MKILMEVGDITRFAADAVVVNLFQGVTEPGGGTGAVNQALGGVLSDELAYGKQFKGKLGETMVFLSGGKLPARYVVLVGLGKQTDLSNKTLRRASAAAVRACKKLKAKTVGTLLHGAGIGGVDAEHAARLVTEGSLLGGYEFTLRKTQKKKPDSEEAPEPLGNPIDKLVIVEHSGDKKAAVEAGIRTGTIIGEATIMTRMLVEDSSNHVTPGALAIKAEEIATSGAVQCKIYDLPEIARMNMGAFLSVGQASDHEPKFIHLTYKPAGTPKKKVALVGKGITFDSGGYSLKPPASQETMKMDMAGAGAVLGAFKAIAELGNLDVEVHGVIPTCENMINGHANKPGDIVTSMNGQTIEINNTDAEGRLILCDALTYAQEQIQPDEILDIATLTGAQVVALGEAASGIMGTSDSLLEAVRKSGAAAGERYWPLPLFEEYEDMLKSEVADLKNAGSKGQAGSSAGGMFLKSFIDKDQQWVHLDIAGPAYASRDYPETPKGATGVGVRTFLYYLYGWQDLQS